MARVTVEDCVLKVPNRFELVLLAAQRAKDIGSGAQMKVEQDRDKNPVIALREIEEDKLDLSELENTLVTGMQKFVKDEGAASEEDENIKAVKAELEESSYISDAEAVAAADGYSEVTDTAED